MQTIFALTFLGFLLFLAEVFVPGMVLGSLGFIFICIAIWMGYATYGPLIGTWIFGIIGILCSGGLLTWLMVFPRTKVGLYISNRKALASPLMAKHQILGAHGVAISMLRPAGIALIEGQRRDVISEGSFIEPNTPLIVIAEEGQKLVVRALQSKEASLSDS